MKIRTPVKGNNNVDTDVFVIFGEGLCGAFDGAWRPIGEAITAVETTKETWCDADIRRTAGEIALMSPEPDATKAEAYFESALAVAQKQQAKSWELRAAMSMATHRHP